jgi:hypothetical protein
MLASLNKLAISKSQGEKLSLNGKGEIPSVTHPLVVVESTRPSAVLVDIASPILISMHSCATDL